MLTDYLNIYFLNKFRCSNVLGAFLFTLRHKTYFQIFALKFKFFHFLQKEKLLKKNIFCKKKNFMKILVFLNQLLI